MRILSEDCQSEKIDSLIALCKSDSGHAGEKLRTAHRELGELVGEMIKKDLGDDRPYSVVCLMRSGYPFGEGITQALGDCPLLLLDEKHDKRWEMRDCNNKFITEYIDFIKSTQVIVADAVINTGTTILQIYDTLKLVTDDVIIAANTIQSEFDPGSRLVYGSRLSSNKFKGSRIQTQSGGKGPDTGDRLFSTLVLPTSN